MPFVEIMPPKRAGSGIGTGVRMSVSGLHGVRVSIAGAALVAIGDADPDARFRVLIDRDPACPRLRIEADPAGGFRQARPPTGDRWRFILLGRAIEGLRLEPQKNLDCLWERVEGRPAIDIDLPREIVVRVVSSHQPAGQPSTSTGPRPKAVTLPGRVREDVA